MWRYLTSVLVLGAGIAAAEPTKYVFEWAGDGGYAMRGAFEYDSENVVGRFVTVSDITCFVVEGTQDSVPVGRWALTMLNEQTTWRLHFDPATSSFLVEGQGIWMPQAWNMDGEGVNCGQGGFGFNIGNAAQDICLDETLIFDSQVSPEQPFPASRVDRYTFPIDACDGPALLGLLGD
jgi:hypothetical protein